MSHLSRVRTVLRVRTALMVLAIAMSGPAFANSVLFPSQTFEVPPRPAGEAPPDVLVPTEPTEEMRAWLRTHVFSVGTEEERMRRLLTALAADRALVYDPTWTGTAAEVFETGHFNCLALTHLLIGLGREMGVDTYYVRVERFRTFHQEDDLVLVSTHVAAAWGPRGQVRLVELEPASERELRAAIRIDDTQAVALHYSNRGAEWLQSGRPDIAEDWLSRAIAIDPTIPEAWVNLGVAHRRQGALDEAEAAYRQAIALAPENLSAWRNLGLVLGARGEDAAADELLQLLDRPDNRNPFTYLALGDVSLEAGRLDEALRFYRRARRISPGNPDTLAALAGQALAAGRPGRARSLLARAEALDSESERVIELGTALGPVPIMGFR